MIVRFYLEWIDYLEMLPPNKAMEILKAIVGLIRDEKLYSLPIQVKIWHILS